MPLERKRRILQVLDRALEEEKEDRDVLVAKLCGEDEGLYREVMSRLEAQAPEGLLDAPVFDVHGEDPAIGRTIGGYRLQRLLGRGGMGTVYLAEREEFEQKVAIKLIRRGFDLDPIVVQRFHNERQILARLEHPYIARLLDGGTSGDHLPYLVMENVEGEAIDVYCRRRQLPIRQRLELFCKVCEAVHFAHQNLVVHRDLKPGNILITAAGEPKLLDFGIAKLLDEKLASQPLATATGEAPMTPRYASPEQIQRLPATTLSDVYVLGVLLFELLTGLDPYGPKTDAESRDQLTQAVCELNPVRPSTAVRRRADELGESPAPSPEKLRRQLLGDLDSIVLKAMRKNPAARYRSAESFADDIRRHLTGQPVISREGTWRYRAGKFVRRHGLRMLLASLSTFVVLLLVNAERRASQALELRLELIGTLFEITEPDKAKGRDLGALDILRAAEQHVFKDDLRLDVKAEWASALGKIFQNLGDFKTAERLLSLSKDASLKRFGAHPETAKRINNLGVLYLELERFEDAELHFRQALKIKKDLGQSGAKLLRVWGNLATVKTSVGAFGEARRIHQQSLEIRRHAATEAEPNLKNIALSLQGLAEVELASGSFDKAEIFAVEALEKRLSLTGDKSSQPVASTENLLGRIFLFRDQREKAKEYLARALASRQERLGDNHKNVAESRRNLAEALIETEPERARELLRQATVVICAEAPESWRLADAESVESLLLLREGRAQEAQDLARSAAQRVAEIRGENSTSARRAYERWLAIKGQNQG